MNDTLSLLQEYRTIQLQMNELEKERKFLNRAFLSFLDSTGKKENGLLLIVFVARNIRDMNFNWSLYMNCCRTTTFLKM